MDVNTYQSQVTRVKKYPEGQTLLYLLAKLSEESGEVSKELRRFVDGHEMKKDLESELGDVLWCITALAEEFGISLESIFETNLKKLKERDLL